MHDVCDPLTALVDFGVSGLARAIFPHLSGSSVARNVSFARLALTLPRTAVLGSTSSQPRMTNESATNLILWLDVNRFNEHGQSRRNRVLQRADAEPAVRPGAGRRAGRDLPRGCSRQPPDVYYEYDD